MLLYCLTWPSCRESTNQILHLIEHSEIEIMNRNNRLSNISLTQNAWCDVVRGCGQSKSERFSAPSLGYGYQPEHNTAQVHSEGWDG